jgi:TP901 family phage tail tape measure protein
VADRNLRIRMLLEASDKFTRPLRDLAGGSTKAAASLKAMRDRLQAIDRAQKDIAGFRELKGGLKTSEAALDAARTRVTALGRALAQTEAPSRKLRAEFNQAKREAAGLETQHQANTHRLGELRDRLRATGIATTDLTRHERELRQEASRTNQELSEQTRRMQTLADRSRRLSTARAGFGRNMNIATGALASGAAGVGAGIAVARPVTGSVREAMAYQSVMTDIAQKANLSREEARKMGLGLIAAAKAANQLPDALQEGVDVLSGLGLDPRKAVAMMKPIGRGATAYKAEIRDLSAAAFAANDNLKVPIAQTAKVIDIMAAAGKSGAFEIKDMAGQFPALTAAYQALGQTGTRAVADLAAGAQIARKGAGDAATAGNNLLNLLTKIGSKETNQNFAKFGIDLPAALKKAAAEGKAPIEAITELTDKALKGDRSKLSYLFGDAQVQGALRPLLENLAEFRRIRDDAMNAKGVTDTDFAERLKDGAEQAKRYEIATRALGLTMGSVLLPAATSLMTKAAELADRFGAWADRNPRAAKSIAILAAAVAGLLFVFGGAAIALAAVMAPFAALSFVATALGVGLLPVVGIATAVVASIVALGAAAYLIYSNWGAIGGFFGNLWTGIQTRFATASAAVTGVFQNMWSGVKAIFSLSLLDVWKGIAYFIGYAFGALVRFGTATYGWLTRTLPGLLASGWTAAWNMLTGAVTGSWAWLTTRLPAMLVSGWNMAINAFKGAMRAAFITLPTMFFDFGVMIIKGLWNGIKSAPGRLWNAGKALASSLSGGFKDGAAIRSPSRVFRALGGHVMNGLTLGLAGGERGPIDRIRRLAPTMAAALALPAAPAMATAKVAIDATPRMAPRGADHSEAGFRSSGRGASRAGSYGGDTYNITVQAAPGQDEQMIVRLLEQALRKIERDKAARARSTYADSQDG